jgi:NitT/TauT family transport system permease protein
VASGDVRDPGDEAVAGGTLATVEKGPGRRRSRLLWRVAPLVFPIVVLIVWYVVVEVTKPPVYLLPSPAAVAQALIRGDLNWPNQFWVTGQEVVGGFLLAGAVGIILAMVISWNPLLSRIILPSVVVFDTLPKVALVPLFLAYLGFGVVPNIFISAIIAFFPVLISSASGLQQANPDLLDLASSLGASRWRVFFRIRLPSAIPFILSGLRIASTLAVTGAVFGEFLASRAGLGSITIQTENNLQTDIAFAGLIYLGIVGYVLYTLVTWAGRALFPWAAHEKDEATDRR